MLISEIIQKRERALLNRDLIELIVRHEAPEKIKLQVFVDVFDSFMAAIKLSDNVSWFNFEKTFATERVYFQYDGKLWCGTVTCYSAIYENRPVLFTNIKLPNDGFFYANDYLVPNSTDDIIETSEVQDAIENFLAIFPSGLKIGKMVVNYKLHEGRFEIYQWNDDESKCLTIKFEYGTYEHFQNKKQFTRRALSELKEKN